MNRMLRTRIAVSSCFWLVCLLHGAPIGRCRNPKSTQRAAKKPGISSPPRRMASRSRVERKGDDLLVLDFQDAKFRLKRADKIVKSGTYKIDSGKKPIVSISMFRKATARGPCSSASSTSRATPCNLPRPVRQGAADRFRSSERLLMVLQRTRRASILMQSVCPGQPGKWVAASGVAAKCTTKGVAASEPKVADPADRGDHGRTRQT